MCSKCGSSFTRASSTRTHIKKFHSGLGAPIKETIYFTYVAAGRLPLPQVRPRPKPTFQASPQPMPTFQTGKSSDEKQKEKSSSEKSLNDRVIEEFYIEFYREEARIAARKLWEVRRWQDSVRENSPRGGTFVPDESVFGLKMLYCNKCDWCTPAYFKYASESPGITRIIARACPHQWANSTPLNERLKVTSAAQSSFILEALMDSLTFWLGEKQRIVAIEITPPKEGSGPVTLLVSASPDAPARKIILSFSNSECIQLKANDTGNWALLAIKEGCTIVNEEELAEFLSKTIDSSFSFVRIAGGKQTQVYFMAVSKEDDNSQIVQQQPAEDSGIAQPCDRSISPEQRDSEQAKQTHVPLHEPKPVNTPERIAPSARVSTLSEACFRS